MLKDAGWGQGSSDAAAISLLPPAVVQDEIRASREY